MTNASISITLTTSNHSCYYLSLISPWLSLRLQFLSAVGPALCLSSLIQRVVMRQSLTICHMLSTYWRYNETELIASHLLYFNSCRDILWVGIAAINASLVAQMVKHLPAIQETWVQSLGQEVPLEKEMAIHSSILAWKIPWSEEPGQLHSMGLQRVRHDWATSLLHFNIILKMSKLRLRALK